MTDFIVEPKELELIVRESVEKKIKIYPRNSLWASQLDHPCLRYNEYALTRWQDQLKITPELQQIFDEGHIHEKSTIAKLEAAGFESRQTQRPLSEQVKIGDHVFHYGISGRLDLEITHPRFEGIWYPAEIKSMEPFGWEQINTLADLLDSEKYYIRMYPGQLMLYEFLMSKEVGLLIIKNKVSGRLKFIWIPLDLERVESMLQKAEAINRVVDNVKENPPCDSDLLLSDRIEYDSKICGGCSFRHICLPDQKYSGESIELDPEIESKLERREILKSYKDEFEELDEEIKIKFKAKGEGKYLVGSSFDVTVKTILTTRYDVPKEIKEPSAVKSEYQKVNITKIK